MSEQPKWSAGQRVALNRERVVTIERVTPSGRAVVEGMTFNPDGWHRGITEVWSKRPHIKALTPAIEHYIATWGRQSIASREGVQAVRAADDYIRRGLRQNILSDSQVVEKAERLIAAINAVLSEP